MEGIAAAKQMKRYDEGTIRRIGIWSPVLMERAALAVVEEMKGAGCDMRAVLVVCGSGNNGGDGFAIARLLDEEGVSVTVLFVGKESSMTEETAAQKKICENCGIKISTNFPDGEYTAIVDAIFGIGLSRKVEGHYAELIDRINASRAFRVAVDIPSGISADTGQVMGRAVRADLTVTFGMKKTGQLLYPGAAFCKRLVCRRIGILPERLGEKESSVFTMDEGDLSGLPLRRDYSNKGSYGRVLMIAGSRGMSGAACLAARAAYKSGCGLVRVFTPECNRQVIQTYLPEAVVSTYDPEAFPEKELEEALAWADVIGIGPGLGTGGPAAAILGYVLGTSRKPVVADADGLNLLAKEPGLLSRKKAPVILTPHVGEMARLTGRPREEIAENLMKTAAELAGSAPGVCCVLKDARTIVTDGSRTYINCTGNHGMAVGGSGDVLTGVICGLLAQGAEPFWGAAFGVLIHGLAGDEARRRLGSYAMMAGDIADEVGTVFKKAEQVLESMR